MPKPSPHQPIFFEPNRVWRCYTGGLLLDRFVGNMAPTDSHFPEDWLGSTVQAVNGDRSTGPYEGLSRVKGADILFEDLLKADPLGYLGSNQASELDILCKYLDSAVRLPIQCHPDVAFSKEFYHSNRGKAEAWAILDTRPIDSTEPYLLMGFKPGINEEAFKEAVAKQDTRAMESMLHKVPARKGDVWLIPGRLPHAIGPGVFLMEIQEPSDWVVQPEAKCADTCLTAQDMWGPLTPEVGLKCFRYEGLSLDELNSRTLMHGSELRSEAGGSLCRIIGPEQTDRFILDRLQISDQIEFEIDAPYCIQVVADGEGMMSTNGKQTPLKQGDVCFLPNGIKTVNYETSAFPMSIYLCKPPLP
jgi:mannose-6-phosphate isomerase